MRHARLLILVGTARAWEDVDTGNALAYVFVVGIAGLFVALLALEGAIVARERAEAQRFGETVARPA